MPIQSVMDHTGPSVFEFDAKNAAAVAEAEQRFKELTGEGFTAFERLDNGRQQIAREFNPTAEETVFVPRVVGLFEPELIEFYKHPTSTIAQRIVTARLKQNLSQSALAEKVGVTRGAVGQWETGTTEPSDANLRRVATETETPYEWLATGRGAEGYSPTLRVRDPLVTAIYVGGLELAGAVEAGVFRAPELEPEKFKRAPVWPDFRYAKASQHAWEVRGDGMNLVGIEDGSYVVATPLEEFKNRYGPLKNGSVVIVQRWRPAPDAAERELSIMEYHFAEAGHIELRPRSTNKAHKSYLLRQPARVGGKWVTVRKDARDRAPVDDSRPGHLHQTEILAVVLAAIRPFSP